MLQALWTISLRLDGISSTVCSVAQRLSVPTRREREKKLASKFIYFVEKLVIEKFFARLE